MKEQFKSIWGGILLIFLIAFPLVFMACKKKEKIIWLNSAKVDCEGSEPMQCYQIRNSTAEPWSKLYQEIAGFDFEPGYIYKLKVTIDTLDQTNLPADKSTLEYVLIEVLSKETDPLLILNDIWALSTIQGLAKEKITPFSMPILEINTRTMHIYGSDGCNEYSGKIERLAGDSISIGSLRSTRKSCPEMDIPNRFNTALSKVHFFKKEGLKLILLDQDHLRLMTFKKVD